MMWSRCYRIALRCLMKATVTMKIVIPTMEGNRGSISTRAGHSMRGPCRLTSPSQVANTARPRLTTLPAAGEVAQAYSTIRTMNSKRMRSSLWTQASSIRTPTIGRSRAARTVEATPSTPTKLPTYSNRALIPSKKEVSRHLPSMSNGTCSSIVVTSSGLKVMPNSS
jgi:hypothetical protein